RNHKNFKTTKQFTIQTNNIIILATTNVLVLTVFLTRRNKYIPYSNKTINDPITFKSNQISLPIMIRPHCIPNIKLINKTKKPTKENLNTFCSSCSMLPILKNFWLNVFSFKFFLCNKYKIACDVLNAKIT